MDAYGNDSAEREDRRVTDVDELPPLVLPQRARRLKPATRIARIGTLLRSRHLFWQRRRMAGAVAVVADLLDSKFDAMSGLLEAGAYETSVDGTVHLFVCIVMPSALAVLAVDVNALAASVLHASGVRIQLRASGDEMALYVLL